MCVQAYRGFESLPLRHEVFIKAPRAKRSAFFVRGYLRIMRGCDNYKVMNSKDVKPIVKQFIEQIRNALGDRVKEIVLFGSHARGDAGKHSDYDILLVVDNPDMDVKDKVYDIVFDFHCEKDTLFSLILYDPERRERLRHYPLGANIEADGIAL